MADPLCTAQNLIDRLDGGAEELRRLCGDDGAGSYDTTSLTRAIATASEEAYGLLLSGFSTVANVVELVENDAAVLDAVCHLTRYALTRWKNEFRQPDGSAAFAREAREARDLLREKSRGAKRSSAEEVTPGPGRSTLLRPRSSSGNTPSKLTDSYGRPVGF